MEKERDGAESAGEETSDSAAEREETKEERTNGEEETDEDKGEHEARYVVVFFAAVLSISALRRVSRRGDMSNLRNWEGIPSSGPAKLRLGSNG